MLYDPKWEVPIETKPLEPWRKLLLDAAAIIERQGHAKYVTGAKNGHVCLFGALNTAHHGHSDYAGSPTSDYPEATAAICRLLGVETLYQAAEMLLRR